MDSSRTFPYPDHQSSHLLADHMATHRIFSDHPLNGRETRLAIVGDEAQHAVRVKRLGPGEPIVVLDGLGKIARCRIAASGKTGREWSLELAVDQVEEAPRVTPRDRLGPVGPRARMGPRARGAPGRRLSRACSR